MIPVYSREPLPSEYLDHFRQQGFKDFVSGSNWPDAEHVLLVTGTPMRTDWTRFVNLARGPATAAMRLERGALCFGGVYALRRSVFAEWEKAVLTAETVACAEQTAVDLKPCLFLDRDGVLVKHVNYLHTPEETELVPEIVDLIRHAKRAGWHVVVVTNQSGVGRGLFSERACQSVHDKIGDELAKQGLAVDAWYACYDHPTHGVEGYLRDSFDRKPKPGMLLKAATALPIDLARSMMIGDNTTDQIQLPDLRVFLVEGDFPLDPLGPRTTRCVDHAEVLRLAAKEIR